MKALILALMTSAAACGGASATTPPPAPPAAGPGGMRQMHAMHGGAGGQTCPMQAPGTQVVAADTADGVAVAFTTTGDVGALREHVRHMAAMHEREANRAGASAHMPMVPSTARVEDIDGGARIVLTPRQPDQLAALRGHVHDHADRMARGECPMMDQSHGEHERSHEHHAPPPPTP